MRLLWAGLLVCASVWASLAVPCRAQELATGMNTVNRVPVSGAGWAKSSVNTAVFRTSSVVSHADTQYVGFYNGEGTVVLAKRKLGTSEWQIHKTQYRGTATDAHNVISIAVDGRGVLHMSWDLHNQPLRYARAVAPGSLELSDEMPMTGQNESRVTYPQFYNLPDGDLLFLYRDGGSGNGNAMLNRYDMQTQTWQPVAHPLVAGGGERNAYLNTLAIDAKGGVHLSWVWRDTPDVATNHDICYAYSPDEGKTWRKSTGETYTLPITVESTEVVFPVPHNSELINQTAMAVDTNDRPLIATYWRDQNSEVPQYRLVWHDGAKWQSTQVGKRTRGFRLSGGGTKRIPISRPQVVAGDNNAVSVIFRDEERGNGVTIASSTNAARTQWTLTDIATEDLGAWEPTYDPVAWKRDRQLHLFVQRAGQGDAETLEEVPPQPVFIWEWTP